MRKIVLILIFPQEEGLRGGGRGVCVKEGEGCHPDDLKETQVRDKVWYSQRALICINGHRRTVKNTKIRSDDGTRECRICNSASEKRRRDRMKLRNALPKAYEEAETPCRRMEEMFEVLHTGHGNGATSQDARSGADRVTSNRIQAGSGQAAS
jgi:hypothetical protein